MFKKLFILVFLVSILGLMSAGCGPSKEELAAIEEAKQAALSAEQAVKDAEATKESVENLQKQIREKESTVNDLQSQNSDLGAKIAAARACWQ